MKVSLSKALYAFSIFMVFTGSFNFGVTRFALIIPFMAFILIISYWANSQVLKRFSIGFIVFAILNNLTLEKNPLVFPPLVGGEITFKQAGYYIKYDRAGGYFSSLPEPEFQCAGCGTYSAEKINAGQKAKVTGINIHHPDFGTKIYVNTDIGEFSEKDFEQKYLALSLNKPIVNRLFIHAGNSVMYLIGAPIILTHWINNIKADGITISIFDDTGIAKSGVLKNDFIRKNNITEVEPGENIRLNCFNAKQLSADLAECDLEFLDQRRKGLKFPIRVKNQIPDADIISFK